MGWPEHPPLVGWGSDSLGLERYVFPFYEPVEQTVNLLVNWF